LYKQIIYSRKEAEKVRDANKQLYGKLLYPDTVNKRHQEPIFATIEYLEIIPANQAIMERCFELYKTNKEWMTESINWISLKDEYMVWAISYQSDLLFVREINEILYFSQADNEDYIKLN
jgi:hypothetical protein